MDDIGLKKILSLALGILVYTIMPRIQGVSLILARFLTYAATLRICLDLNSVRALGLGLDLEDPEVIRDHFYLAALVTLIIFLMNSGALAQILNPRVIYDLGQGLT